MHSSRMRTARLLPVSSSMSCSRGMYLPGGCTCPGGVPASWCTCQGVNLPGGVPARGCTCPGGVPAQRFVPAQGGVPVKGVYLPEVAVPTRESVPARNVPARGGVYLPEGGVPAQVVYLPRWCTCQGVCTYQ